MNISYTVDLFDPARHLLLVTLTLDAGQKRALPISIDFALPAWIPGSYLVRDFARHITQISALGVSGNKTHELSLTKLDKHTWRADCSGLVSKGINQLTVSTLVYAWDLSVRGAHFDETHCFFNGSSVFLQVKGFEQSNHSVTIASTANEALKSWKIATAMPRQAHSPSALPATVADDNRFIAANYDELIDHPFEIGVFQYARFKACGVVHHVTITGRAELDMERLCQDLKPICEAQIKFFEPGSEQAPFKTYWFMTTAIGEGYGGLEHRASTALICNRTDLPFKGMEPLTGETSHEGYKTFLGLCSHEYFHSWNVKRIKPEAFSPYNLNTENYTRLLWIFEGFTSYYDDLFLVRSGRIDTKSYLKTIAATISGVHKTPGRLRQSVADSSFDAWTKYYKQDENSVNAIISYYTKGSLVALALDLTIRQKTANKHSLDDVMRALWTEFKAGKSLGEEAFADVIQNATGLDLSSQIKQWAYGTSDIALDELFAHFGLQLANKAANGDAVWLGAKLGSVGAAGVAVINALGHGPLAQAGISAGDMLVAVDGIKATEKCLAAVMQRKTPGESINIHAFRRDELMQFTVILQIPPKLDAVLTIADRQHQKQRKSLEQWIGKA